MVGVKCFQCSYKNSSIIGLRNFCRNFCSRRAQVPFVVLANREIEVSLRHYCQKRGSMIKQRCSVHGSEGLHRAEQLVRQQYRGIIPFTIEVNDTINLIRVCEVVAVNLLRSRW